MKAFWLINLGLFQLAWWSAAWLTNSASYIISGLIILHCLLSPCLKADLRLMALLPLGLLVDGALIALGAFRGIESAFPLWLALLWVIFLMSLNHSLRLLSGLSLPWLMLIGALGGAGSYWAGLSLGALTTQVSGINFWLIAAPVWAVLLPLLVWGQGKVSAPQASKLTG
ncbi:DUF2878 domain-containing protein [Shewanella insulae]|uniref:DUF2878 family protein n=1 Tax=Shewanella insulae TaxID=2681496 RepID=A0A6L7HVR5_9GAMM|nr:DUF2878 domain-containing protein [Shewanella insulae]MCG9711572.1 DUF2878 domain-containing protein [Shewanella insulae]MXR68447.1 DUF2878 family protein [Shewanella insulae]